ncbi:hypothetical protein [Sorangium sp. So ce1097]
MEALIGQLIGLDASMESCPSDYLAEALSRGARPLRERANADEL